MCSVSGVDDDSLVRFYGARVRANTGLLRPRQLLRHGRWFEFGTIRWVGAARKIEDEGDKVGHRRVREDVPASAGGGGAGCGGAAGGDARGRRRGGAPTSK